MEEGWGERTNRLSKLINQYKEKYANVTKHMIQMTLYKYPTVATTATSL